MKKFLFIALGAVTFALGTLGIFLPFLPTTVFYLLTGFFWLRSSDKLYNRFIQSESYQKYVEKPILQKNISTKNMIKMFLAIFIVFLIPCIIVDNLMMRVTMGIVYVTHVVLLTWYLKGKNRSVASAEVGNRNDR
ncbi:YbaN family protein [Enterococcus sp. BWM-S5]|uniref:YbaN family protein n=1 Tax=Enterococcus larvae TaxID=2794352 RepID=A0ABS4CPB2_9ENTE|nr:YbaN family protein [Enterococcus larvae]MBP1048405.1 YbaN family protein [Enterococcus larvae]